MLEYRFSVLFYEKDLGKFLISYRPSTCTSLKLRGEGGGANTLKSPDFYGHFWIFDMLRALELTSISSSLIYAECFNDII